MNICFPSLIQLSEPRLRGFHDLSSAIGLVPLAGIDKSPARGFGFANPSRVAGIGKSSAKNNLENCFTWVCFSSWQSEPGRIEGISSFILQCVKLPCHARDQHGPGCPDELVFGFGQFFSVFS